LACMCGNVLQGRTDPSLPFFTEAGSFWTNNTDMLLQETTKEQLGETRNVCNAEGYLSVALIPLRSPQRTIGLLQLNDERPDRFTLELIEFLERLSESIGIALARLDEENRRKELESEREQLLQQYQLRINELDTLYRISKLQENQDLTTDEILELIVNLLPGSTQYPEMAVAKLNIEDQTYTSSGYQAAPRRYSALIQSYGVIVGKLEIGYLKEGPKDSKGPFLEEEIKLVNLVAETISRMLERKKTGDWKRSIDKYALILNDDEMRHITKLVLEDMAIGEMDREEYNIKDVPDDSTQTIDSYMSLQFNLELNRGLILKLQNLLNSVEPI
jgi:GAF domain